MSARDTSPASPSPAPRGLLTSRRLSHQSPLPRRELLTGLLGLAACRAEATPEPPASSSSSSLAAAAAQARRVEIVHDTVCPWCRIGCHNLHAAIDALGPSVAVEVVYRPYLLEPDAPPGGADLREQLGKKYGHAKVASMFAGVTEAGAKAGVHFDFDKVRIHPQTAPSHALIAWAPPAKRRALVTAIHEAYFLGGKDIGDASALAAIAEGVGLDGPAARAAALDPQRIAATRALAAQAQESGIRGVPHVIIGGKALHGAQPVEALRKAIAEG